MRARHAPILAALGVLLAAHAAAADPESLARAMALEQDRLARDRTLLRIDGHDFDPLVSSACPSDDRATLCGLKEVAPVAAGDAAPWLVQVSGQPMQARAALAAAGIEILGYYPNSAWLVRVRASQLAKLSSLPSVRWSGAWSPAWKLSPGLLSRIPSGGETELALSVELQPGTRIAPWKAHLEATPGATIVAMNESATEPTFATLDLVLAPEDLGAALLWLASLRDVARVTEREPLALALDAAVPLSQTGIDSPNNYDVTAKLFARGVTGHGIIVGLSDDGLENDDCRFVYGPDVDEAAWPLGPSALAPGPVVAEGHFAPGQPPPVRTRERKVVAYYLQTGAEAYSTSNQHGTKVGGCIAGDDNGVLAAQPIVRDVGDLQDVRPMNPTGEWTVGERLRNDLLARVDDPAASEPAFPTTFGTRVQHHGSGDGMAPGAQLVVQDIGRADGALVDVDLELMMAQAHGTGATGYNVSWGTPDGCVDCYGVTARKADMALWRLRDLSGVASAGNSGTDGSGSIMGGAAHAKSVMTAGATSAATQASCATCVPPGPRRGENREEWSSLGPSSGGRLSPELMTSGVAVMPSMMSVQPEDGSGSGDFGCPGPWSEAGTSFSAGNLSGLSALVQQYFRDGYYPSGSRDASKQLRPTNALVRAVLVNSARDLRGLRTDDTGLGVAHRPSFGQGWGAPRLDDTLYFAGDPTHDDPLGDTERARLVVFTDTPNGFDGSSPLTPEPGGRTRADIVTTFQRAMTDGAVHEFVMFVANPDRNDVANELRVTLAWTDAPGLSASAPLVNDLDLEVISPGPDGILQTSTGSVLLGDDIVYRTNPLVAWSGGYSQPSAARRLQSMRTPFDSALPDADRLNTVENVFIPASDVVEGAWRVRVIGYSVPGGIRTQSARPNFVLGDRPPVLDLDGDGVAEMDVADAADATDQGYALLASGRFMVAPFTRPRVTLPPRRPPRRPPGPPRGPRL